MRVRCRVTRDVEYAQARARAVRRAIALKARHFLLGAIDRVPAMNDPAMRAAVASIARRSPHVDGTTLDRVGYPVFRIGSHREPGRGGEPTRGLWVSTTESMAESGFEKSDE